MGAASTELEGSGHVYCPISKEAGIAPRRSIDVAYSHGGLLSAKQQHNNAPEKAAISHSSGPDQSSVWHPSIQWSVSTALGPSSNVHTDGPHPAPQQLQQLAEACRNRDAKQVLCLAAKSPTWVSDAADAAGNTALHLALLPNAGPGSVGAAAGAAPVSPTSSSKSGGLSWLTGCFGVPPANGVSRMSSFRSLSAPAALQAQQQVVAALLAAGADANARNKQGLTPLMLAVEQLLQACNSSNSLVAPALRVLEQLCKHALLDPNMKDEQGRTALVLLLQGQPHGTAGSKQQLHDSVRSGSGHFSRTSSSVHPVSAAAPASAASITAFGAVQLKAVQMLLHCRADCNAADKAGVTLLMVAASQPAVTKELLQLLLERGANTRQLDNSHRSALTHALLAHKLQLVPAVGASSSSQAHCAACSSCSKAVVAPAGAAADGQQTAPVTAADVHAAEQHSTELIKAAAADTDALPARFGPGADAAALNAVAEAMTASTMSCSTASSAWDSCASPDLHAQVHTCSMYSGITAASCSGSSAPCAPNPQHSVVVRALCSYGALDLHPASINTRFPGLNNFTQLHIAMRRGDVMALQMLLAGGADVNATDTWGNSPLMYWPVVPSEPSEVVEELVGKLLSHVSVRVGCGHSGAGWDSECGDLILDTLTVVGLPGGRARCNVVRRTSSTQQRLERVADRMCAVAWVLMLIFWCLLYGAAAAGC